MVVSLLSLTLLGLLLVGPGAAGVVVAWGARSFAGAWGRAPALLVALGVALVELRLVVGWLGGLFERTEPGDIHSG